MCRTRIPGWLAAIARSIVQARLSSPPLPAKRYSPHFLTGESYEPPPFYCCTARCGPRWVGACRNRSDHEGNASDAPPFPLLNAGNRHRKGSTAEDGWNSRDAAKVTLAYTLDTRWRNRVELATNRQEAQAFLARKWKKECEYRLIKELWAFKDNRIAARHAYEYCDDSGQWFRAYGNENWLFAADGLMSHRHSSINEMPIAEADRKFLWPLGRRPDDYPSLSDFGF